MADKLKQERASIDVENFSHNWFVVEKKSVGSKINYYLLQDCIESDGVISGKNIYRALKESLDYTEKFSGKIMYIKDKKKKFTKEVHKVVGKSIESKMVDEPYVHHLDDVGEVPDDEARSIFGSKYIGYRARDKAGNIENLLKLKTAK